MPDDEATDIEIPERVRADADAVSVAATDLPDGSQVTVVARDRIGLLADAAATLALAKVSVRAAHAWTQDGFGVSVWDVAETGLDDILLRQRMEAIADGRIDAASRLRRARPVKLEPTVAVRPEASPRATVIEVLVGRPAGADPHGLRHPRGDRHLGAIGPRLDAGPPGGRRVLRAGGLGGRPLGGTGGLGGACRPAGAGGGVHPELRSAGAGLPSAATLGD